MSSIGRRLEHLERSTGEGQPCPECQAVPGGPIEFIIRTRDEAGEGPDKEQCLTCGWPKKFTFSIQQASAMDTEQEGETE